MRPESDIEEHANEGLDKMSAYLQSVALARKIAEPSVDWNLEVRDVLNEPYPD
jgi:hypothetical protein